MSCAAFVRKQSKGVFNLAGFCEHSGLPVSTAKSWYKDETKRRKWLALMVKGATEKEGHNHANN